MASNAQFLAVILLHLCTTSSSLYLGPPRQAHDYLRFADVSRHCQSVLSSATELTYEANRPYHVRHQLSFEKGDWHQDAGHAPLLPFNAGDAPKEGARRLADPLSLATFVVTHVGDEEEHRARAAVNVSGVLCPRPEECRAGVWAGYVGRVARVQPFGRQHQAQNYI